MESSKKHLYILDALRGFAALSVCIWHFSGKVLPKLHVDSLYSIVSWGWVGVTVFFVISGFIIPYIMYKGNYKLKDFGSFMGKRFIRIAPPSYIIIIFILLEWWFGQYIYKSDHFNFSHLTTGDIVSNFTYTAPFFHYEWINGVFWTLTQEFQFYILVGLTFTLSFRNIYTFLVFSIAVIGLHYIPVPQYEFFGRYGTLFLMGSLTTLYYTKRINIYAFLSCLIAITIVSYIQVGITNAAFGIGTALIIAFLHFKTAVTTFLGKISYSIYLIHILCAPVYETFFIKLFHPQSDTVKVVMQLIIILMTIATSYIYYLIVEKYFIRLSHKLFSQREKTGKQMLIQPS